MPIPNRPFYLIRHGQTVHNVANIGAGGDTDSELTELGYQQAETLSQYIHALPKKPKKIIHSPLKRATETARVINTALKLDMEDHADLVEHRLGIYEEKPWEPTKPKLLANEKLEGGENRDEFAERVKNAFHDIFDRHAEDPLMIVGHSGLFHSLRWLYYRYNDYIYVPNSAIHYFEPCSNHDQMPWKITIYEIENDQLVAKPSKFCPSQNSEPVLTEKL